MVDDISYKNYKKKNDIHGSVLYPAVMVAPIQKDILNKLIKGDKIKNIFDPFHGSGTALYEALEISNQIELIGCDINPLANLITKVKLQGVTDDIISDIEKLEKYIVDSVEYEIYTFTNIEKWFREDIIKSLSLIRHSIMKIRNYKNRLYFWYMLSDIVRKYSNTRSSTYKLHIKKEESINRMKNNVIEDYISAVKENVDKFKKHADKFKLFKCDILEKIKDFNDNSIDISITSPPYGDNATTVTYGQFSILTLLWIDRNDLELDGWELSNFSVIDSRSLGGRLREVNLNKLEKDLINPYITRISEKKIKKVEKFFNDYFLFLKELTRVTNKYIVMTLGNRTVDGVNINLTNITQVFLSNHGFKEEEFIEREIPCKRIPKKTSSVNNKPVSSMNYEYLIIYKKTTNIYY